MFILLKLTNTDECKSEMYMPAIEDFLKLYMLLDSCRSTFIIDSISNIFEEYDRDFGIKHY